MKASCIGISRQHGISKKTGKPYDMARVMTLQPIEVIATQDFSRDGYGYQSVEIDVEPSALSKFAGVKFPCELDLATTDRIFMGRIQTVVTGFNPPAPKTPA